MGNSNDNAFKMRKLFKMYDRGDTGMVRFATRFARFACTLCAPGAGGD